MGAIQIMYVGLVLLSVLCIVYAYIFLGRICSTIGLDKEKKAVKGILVVLSVGIGCLCVDIYGFGAVIIFYLYIPQLLMEGLNLIMIVLSAVCKKSVPTVWKKIYASCIVPILTVSLLTVFGYQNMHEVDETTYIVETDKQIREEGYRIALLADLHFGNFQSLEDIRKYCEEIGNKNIDLVVLCGDIVDEKTSEKDMRQVFQVLSEIPSTYGVYYVFGNHDRQEYSATSRYTEEDLINVMEQNGIIVLKDQVSVMNEEVVIVGREDFSFEEDRKSVTELLNPITKDNYIIMLDHQPKEFTTNASAGVDLILSGHTHGGQLWPLQILFKALNGFEDIYGCRRVGENCYGIITSGVAGWGLPVKTAAPSEYVIIDVKSK